MRNSNSKRFAPLLKNLIYTVGLGVIIILVFFYWFLPKHTNHGETITVPDITKRHINDLNDILLTRSLRYEVNPDSSFTEKQPAYTVIDQFPFPNSKVKEGRKIYVTLNAKKPPLAQLPDFTNGKSQEQFILTTRSIGLKIKIKKYILSSIKGDNTIAEAWHKGKRLKPGSLIPRGATIELVVFTDNLDRILTTPDVVNVHKDEAELIILGNELTIRDWIKVNSPRIVLKDSLKTTVNVPDFYVVKQEPISGSSVLAGDPVDLWYYDPTLDTLTNSDSVK